MTNAWKIIEAEAAALGVSDEAMRKWRERGRVPYRFRLPILIAAEKHGTPIDAAAFDSPPPRRSAA